MSISVEERLLKVVKSEGYTPLKPKALARRLKIEQEGYDEFRHLLKSLLRRGELSLDKRHAIRPARQATGFVGTYKAIRAGGGFVRARPGAKAVSGDIRIAPQHAGDAASGDLVRVELGKKRTGERTRSGRIVEVVSRGAGQFVGTYDVQNGEGFVRVDGGTFFEPIYVGDAGAKGARAGDKVVFEMLRYPSAKRFGEGVLTEVLGKRGEPGVDLISVIRQFELPDAFADDAVAEAHEQARKYEDQNIEPDRRDLTGELVITIDPVDARDFDDAISLERSDDGHWRLGVHIADVSHFVRPDTALDREARTRGTSVYLPGRVLPMLPEVISNGLASLQQDRVRYTKTAFVDFDPKGRITRTSFANTAIKVTKRFTYEQVLEFFEGTGKPTKQISAVVADLLKRMRELARLLRERRRVKGMLELSMPAPELEYDQDGRVSGCHYAHQDEAHQVIEEFMLTANEAVAQRLADDGVHFLRRVHPSPDPLKLKLFAEFARSLGLEIDDYANRFALQAVLRETKDDPRQPAIHYALLRSLREAYYGPDEDGHYALASDCYCHFTSPIRRYPDLTVHRLLDQLIRRGKGGSDVRELANLGAHCSFTERRAEKAERELVKLKLLEYMTTQVGKTFRAVVTGVEEFGLFCQGVEMPAEGLLHIRSLPEDYYTFDRATHSLTGRRQGNAFRLGDSIDCEIVRVDIEARLLTLRPISEAEHAPRPPKRSETRTLKKKAGKKPTKAPKKKKRRK